jgi:N-acyl homoserine lactone hydrolase
VVQTHLHSDHVGRMSAFSNATFYVPQADYPMSNGALPCRLPANFVPQFADFDTAPLPGFERGFALTQDGDVWIVPTPGHSMGHQSVLLLDGELSMLFAGDVAFDEAQLLSGAYGGIVADVDLTRQSLGAIRTYAAERPLVFLPTHDPESADRFEARTTIAV